MVFVATGRPPFGADSIPQVVQRIVAAEADLTGLPAPLRDLVRDCLTKNPAARPTARQILLRLLGQNEGEGVNMPVGAPAPGAVGADVLAQAATIAGIRPFAGPGGAATVRSPVADPVIDPDIGPVVFHVADPAVDPPVDPDANRPALSRAFIAAGLAAVVVAIAALLLPAMRPHGASGNPSRGSSNESPAAGQVEPLGTEQNGRQPMDTGQSQPPANRPSGAATRQATTNGSGYGAGGHGTATPTWTPTPTWIPTPTWTPTATWTPTSTPTVISTPTAMSTPTPGGSASTFGYRPHTGRS
jgi:hypothetical protein